MLTTISRGSEVLSEVQTLKECEFDEVWPFGIVFLLFPSGAIVVKSWTAKEFSEEIGSLVVQFLLCIL